MNDLARRQARRIRRVLADILVPLRTNARWHQENLRDARKNLTRLSTDHSLDTSDEDIERAERQVRHVDGQKSWAESKVQLVEELEKKIGKILAGGKP